MEALPAVVPFFGIMLCITTGWGVFLSRRIRTLENRVEAIEARPLTQVVVESKPVPSYPPTHHVNVPYLPASYLPTWPRPPYTIPPAPSAPAIEYSNPEGVYSKQMQ